jgi:CheY-like chemotaxis protein
MSTPPPPTSVVLIVDDNDACADSLAMLVRLWGYQCAVAYSGATALALAAELRPDVALLDLAMRNMDGYELARRLRAIPGLAQLPLVAVTGYADDAHRRECLAAGFAFHLAKAADPEELKALLSVFAKEKAKGTGEVA